MARSPDLRIHIVRCSQTVLFVWIHRFNQPFCPWLQSYGKEVVGWNLKTSRILANFHEKLGWIGLGLGKLVGWLTFVELPNAGGVSQCINQKNLCLCTPVLYPKSMESEVWMECEQGPQLYSTEEEGGHVITSKTTWFYRYMFGSFCNKQNRILFGNILLDGWNIALDCTSLEPLCDIVDLYLVKINLSTWRWNNFKTHATLPHLVILCNFSITTPASNIEGNINPWHIFFVS